MSPLAFDVPLCAALFWIAWRALAAPDVFKAVVLFITFGLLMALAWVRLGAPDIALAEAAIGAGITGALLLDAAKQIEVAPAAERHGRGIAIAAGVLSTGVAVALALALLDLPPAPVGLGPAVYAALPEAGVAQPVTAVLLNFRAYDTWLELGVLLLAVLALLALRRTPEVSDAAGGSADPLLESFVRVLAPLMVLAGGYLLWLGTHAPGGAFQAGALFGGAGVLLRVAGMRSVESMSARALHAAAAAGFLAFLLVALGLLAFGEQLLEYRREGAYALMLIIETAAAVGIACTLAALFAGATPRLPRP